MDIHEKVEGILRSVGERVQRLLPVDRFYAALYDADRDEVSFPVVLPDGGDASWTARELHTELLSDWLMHQSEPRSFSGDGAAFQEQIEAQGLTYWPGDDPPQAWIGAPMVAEGGVIGALVVENRRSEGAFGRTGPTMLATVARQTAVAIQNARLYARLERRAKSMQVVNELGQELTSGIRLGEQEILELIHEKATQLMDTANMYIALYEPDLAEPDIYNPEEPERSEIHGTVRFGLMFVDGEPREVPSRKAKWGEYGRTEEIIRTRNAILIRTRAESEEWYKEPGRREHIDDPFAAWVGVPMLSGDSVLGVIATYHKKDDYVYDEDDALVLSLMAGQAAVAIENAGLWEQEQQKSKQLQEQKEQLQKRTHQLAALQDIGVKLTAQLEIEDVLTAIVEYADELMSADFSTLLPYDPELEQFAEGLCTSEEVSVGKPRSGGFTAEVAEKQKPVFAEDAASKPGEKPELPHPEEIRSFVSVPLVVKRKTVGVLYVNFLERHLFSEEQKQVAEMLANQAAVAIENARLYRELGQTVWNLKEAQEEIANAERALVRTGLAADFAHKMNNMAGTIPNWVNLIKRKLGPTGTRNQQVVEYLDNIDEEAKDILREARRLKDPIPGPEQVDLVDLVQSIVGQIELMTAPDISIAFHSDDALPPIRGIRAQLETAILNIVDNSRKAITSEGEITIALEHETDSGRSGVQLRISDTGCGIEAELLDDIFEFGTVHWADGKGTGYGLWRTRSIIRELGGNIEVESRPGHGSTFTVFLPVAEE